jgi:hypothetical protein
MRVSSQRIQDYGLNSADLINNSGGNLLAVAQISQAFVFPLEEKIAERFDAAVGQR